MFWRFGGQANVSSLDQILDRPGFTLEELLDEGDLIQELKQQSSKLIEFLRNDAVLQKLLRYALADPISIPPPDEQVETALGSFGKVDARSRSKSVSKTITDTDYEALEAQRRKYAYISSEILSSEVWSITEALVADDTHLRGFWEYLRRPAPLDPLQATYFTKINENLLDKKPDAMFAFLQTLDGLVPEMLKHVDCPMIMDLLLKMISLEKQDAALGIVEWLRSQDLLLILLSYLAPDNPPAYQTSAGDFLKAIITISANATAQDQTVIGPNELTRQLVSDKCVSQLIEYMLHGGNPLTVGVGIIIEVIRKNNSDYDGEFEPGPEPRTTDSIYLGLLLRKFSLHIADFMHLVRSPAVNKPLLKTAFKANVQPLGFDRFKTCELMAELLHCSNMALLNQRGSDAEYKARDAERERLKAQGRLTQHSPRPASQQDEPFTSSVDSQGYHHAERPPDRPTDPTDTTTPNDDGFEKVDAPSLPDTVSFDDAVDSVDDLNPTCSDTTFDSSRDIPQRVSSLTKQIQDHLEITPHAPEDEDGAASAQAMDASAARHPEYKPAPLFARKSEDQSGDDPVLGVADRDDAPVDPEQDNSTLLHSQDDQAEDSERFDYIYEPDLDGSPVVGDLLKMQFVEHQVIPTILDFFFRFPWNNFLHNVVYDVVQQIFNGTLERGYNRQLGWNLFRESTCTELESQADIVHRILQGQAMSDKSQAANGMRLGYMGHLTLIAEEVCKYADRHPPDYLAPEIAQHITSPEWIEYVDGILTETRQRDNAILGGVKPDSAGNLRAALSAGLTPQGNGNLAPVANTSSTALADAGLTGGTLGDELPLTETDPSEEVDELANMSPTYATNNASADPLGDDIQDLSLEESEETTSPVRLEVHTTTTTSTSPSSGSTALPPPLNVPPSRARRQLAVRLEARRREAENAELDPDAADAVALETASVLPATEPLTSNPEGDAILGLGPEPGHLKESRSPDATAANRMHQPSPSFSPDRFSNLFVSERQKSGSSEDGHDGSRSDSDSDDELTSMGPPRQRPSPDTHNTMKSASDETESDGLLASVVADYDERAGMAGQGSQGSYETQGAQASGQHISRAPTNEAHETGNVSVLAHDEDEGDSSDGDVVEIRPRRTGSADP